MAKQQSDFFRPLLMSVAGSGIVALGRLYLMAPSRNFSWNEATTTSHDMPNDPSPAERLKIAVFAWKVLELVRTWTGGPLHVNSWFRSAAVNKAAGGVSNSVHMSGLAADVWSDRASADDIARYLWSSNLPISEAIVYWPGDGITERIHIAMDWGAFLTGGRGARYFGQTWTGKSKDATEWRPA